MPCIDPGKAVQYAQRFRFLAALARLLLIDKIAPQVFTL
jgi:hypothetical protein